MILIVTNKSDVHCNPVIKHFSKNNDIFFRLNTECLIEDYDFTFNYNNSGSYFEISNKKNGKKLHSRDIISVWERRPLAVELPSNIDKQIKEVMEQELDELLKWIRYDLSDFRSIGSAIWDRPNESKLRQMNIAKKILEEFNCSISIPKTLISNVKEEIIKEFQNFKHLVIKPIGADGIELDDKFEMPFFSRKIDQNELKNISSKDIQICPTFIQNYVEKEYELRVTVVGSKFFSCKILSQLLPLGEGKEDWREGYKIGLPQEWIETPIEIENFCNRFLEKINSSFGCFDFIKGMDNKYYFLECNPNGQWMWQEEEIGIPISKAIADFLSFRLT